MVWGGDGKAIGWWGLGLPGVDLGAGTGTGGAMDLDLHLDADLDVDLSPLLAGRR